MTWFICLVFEDWFRFALYIKFREWKGSEDIKFPGSEHNERVRNSLIKNSEQNTYAFHSTHKTYNKKRARCENVNVMPPRT